MRRPDRRQLRLPFPEDRRGVAQRSVRESPRCRVLAVEAFDGRLPLGFLLLGVVLCGYTALTAAWLRGRAVPKISAPVWSVVGQAVSPLEMPTAAEPGPARVAAAPKPHEVFLSAKIKKINPSVDAKRLAALIVQHAARADLDPLVLAALIKGESTFDARAQSPQGAVGLMQIMPHTARYIAHRQGLAWSGVNQLHDPGYNLHLGIAYMKYLLEIFDGSYELAFLAYNWGPGNLQEALARKRPMDPEVHGYARSLSATIGAWKREFMGRQPAV